MEESNLWSDDELRDSVKEYVSMHRLEIAGEKFNKSQIYRHLAGKYNRSPKSFEFRMQNISYVYELMGRKWITGLKPKRNISPKQCRIIESFIAEFEGNTFNDVTYFEADVNEVLKKKIKTKPIGNLNPKQTNSSSNGYSRDRTVKGWVLQRADGVCEKCHQPAPFVTPAGRPYLEVHHLVRLVDGGEDTPENCVAVCPNCHRELHFGINK